MSDMDRFEAWWKTLDVYNPIQKALAGSAWMEAIRASKPIPPDPHIALMEAEHDDRMQQCVLPEQPQPAEDPDEWVIQDRVPVRPGIDQVCWNEKLFDPQSTFGFIETCRGSQSDGKMHGYNADGIFLSVRCRRRDLPKVEQDEQWPKYWTTFDPDGFAFVKQITADECQCIFKDGTHGPVVSFNHEHALDRKQLTEAEAMALLNKPKQCAVGCHGPRCPNPALPDKDHGSECADEEPQPQKTRVRLWISAVDASVYFGESPKLRTDCEILVDSEGFYVENQPC